MTDNSANNKRIAKNTILLYGRMVLLMVISLYTSRVILANLGVENFGIYNVVGGIVTMFTMISGAMSASISRFITFELGSGDKKRLKEVFATSVIIQIAFSIIFVILVESVGCWFLDNKLVIPEDRLYAALWVLRFSAITFVINLISVPYNAAIVAHEKMAAFAYISLVEAAGKLAVAWLISCAPFDKLIFYALLLSVIAVIVRLIYGIYCSKNFEECKFRVLFDKKLLSQMFSFAGWNMVGATSAILRDQGGNILINMFGGPVVNAARGIAFQVNHALLGFVSNFQTALNPQIIKNYASGNYDYTKSLIFQGARFSYYILFVLALPFLISTHYILQLWLGIVPDHSVLFVRLTILFSLAEAFSGPLITGMYATGKIKAYQICVGGLQMLNFPVSYILLKQGFIPEIVMAVAIALSFLCMLARLVLLYGKIGFSSCSFLLHVVLNCLGVSILASSIPVFLLFVVDEHFGSFVLLTIVSLVMAFFCVLYVGCNQSERQMFYGKLGKMLKKMVKK